MNEERRILNKMNVFRVGRHARPFYKDMKKFCMLFGITYIWTRSFNNAVSVASVILALSYFIRKMR